MHHIYHTEGFILKSVNSSEANKTYYIFTRDFGLVKATAQGVRLLKSKLKASLDAFSKAEVSLVRGKGLWRIVGAKKIFNYKDIAGTEDDALGFVSRILLLLLRLIHGEEKNEELFDNLDRAFSLFDCTALKDELEILSVATILYNLGHIKDHEGVLSVGISPESLDIVKANKKKLLFEINNAINESHL